MGRSARGWMTLAIDESDPGDDLPDIVVGLENFAERRHRSDDVLGTLAHEALLFECISRTKRARAERDDAEQGVVSVAVDSASMGSCKQT